MSVLGDALAAGRREHEALMVDQIRIHRPGPGVFDQTTGATQPGSDLVLYEGKARAKPIRVATSTEIQSGEREVRLHDYEVTLPWATTVPTGQVIRPGDQILILAAQDPRMAGSTLWVTGRQSSSLATAWRIYAEDREA